MAITAKIQMGFAFFMNVSHLNLKGQACVAVVGSIVVNAAVHPLCTIKNQLMANQLLPSILASKGAGFKSLYRGYVEMCATDAASYAVCYVVNGAFKKYDAPPFAAAILAGIASSPIVTIGEACMVNRQLHAHVISTKLLKNALQTAGLIATVIREVPFSIAIFAFAPAVEKILPLSNELTSSTLAGFISGSICGAITAPADTIKTRVQANHAPFFQTAQSVWLEMRAQGKRTLKNCTARAIYVGCTVTILNVLNSRLPHMLPKGCLI